MNEKFKVLKDPSTMYASLGHLSTAGNKKLSDEIIKYVSADKIAEERQDVLRKER